MNNVTIFAQRDPRWAGEHLGTDEAPHDSTIGKYGCLVCALASGISDSLEVFPNTLNGWLKDYGGYQKGNRFVFDSISTINFELALFANTPNPQDVPTDKIDDILSGGGFCVVEVKVHENGKPIIKNGEPVWHWVRLLDTDAGMVMDPWHGDIVPIAPRYGANLSEAVWRVAVYKKIPAPILSLRR